MNKATEAAKDNSITSIASMKWNIPNTISPAMPTISHPPIANNPNVAVSATLSALATMLPNVVVIVCHNFELLMMLSC